MKMKFLLITLTLAGACQYPDDDFGATQKVDKSKKTNFQLSAEVIAAPLRNQEILQLEIKEVSICNLGESIIGSIFGVIENQNSPNESNLPHGQIDLHVPSSGCYLLGDLRGTLISESGRIIVDANIEVSYGTGTFQADGGALRLTIIGTIRPDQQMRYAIEIDGYLENEIPVASN